MDPLAETCLRQLRADGDRLMAGQLAGLPNWLRPVVEDALRSKNLEPDDVEECDLNLDPGAIGVTLGVKLKQDIQVVDVKFTIS